MSDEKQELPSPKVKSSCVMSGHIIDHDTGEAFVAVYCVGGSRLSVAGARILAAQIAQWADHAEKYNANHPKEEMASFMLRVLDKAKQWQHVPAAEKIVDPNEGKPDYVPRRNSYSAEIKWEAEPKAAKLKKPRTFRKVARKRKK